MLSWMAGTGGAFVVAASNAVVGANVAAVGALVASVVVGVSVVAMAAVSIVDSAVEGGGPAGRTQEPSPRQSRRARRAAGILCPVSFMGCSFKMGRRAGAYSRIALHSQKMHCGLRSHKHSIKKSGRLQALFQKPAMLVVFGRHKKFLTQPRRRGTMLL